MDDLISRLSELRSTFNCFDENERDAYRTLSEAIKVLSEVRPIGYQYCLNAMLHMWWNNVVTDEEYFRIMDKLNAYWEKKDG